MKIIAIAGKVDSRIIAYPLARALSLSGLTALIADDGAYRRLFFGDELKGTVSGVDISVGLKADDDLKNSLNDSGVPYDYKIIVTSGYIPPEVTGVIICKGVDKSMLSDDTQDDGEIENSTSKKDDIEVPKGIPFSTVYVSFDTPPKDGASAINLRDTAMRYIYSCEERKELQMLDDKSLNKLIVKIATEVVGLNPDELLKLMLRKEYVSSK